MDEISGAVGALAARQFTGADDSSHAGTRDVADIEEMKRRRLRVEEISDIVQFVLCPLQPLQGRWWNLLRREILGQERGERREF